MILVSTLVKRVRDDSLYRNAFFLSSSAFVMAGIGFFFWMICSRIYTPEQIGLATTLISLTSLITSFSMFGLNTSIVRFLPTAKDKNALINTAFGVIIIGSVAVTLIVLAGLQWISPRLAFIRDYPLFELSMIVFMIVASLNGITDSVFIANRKTEFILVLNTIQSLVKLVTPTILVTWGTYGIFYGFMTSINAALVLSVICMVSFLNYQFRPKIQLDEVKKMWKYSFGTYIAGIVGLFNTAFTPILITNILGPAMTAYFFMPSMIIVLVNSIPRALASSMTAEGAYTSDNLRILYFRSLRASYMIAVPLILALVASGSLILSIFGTSYSIEGLWYLKVALISTLFTIPNTLLATILYVRKQIQSIVLISTLSTLIFIILATFLLKYGLVGVPIADIITQFLLIFVYISFVFKN